MAVDGAFAVRCHETHQSLVKDFGGGFISVLNNIKSRVFPNRVYVGESGFGLGAQLHQDIGECLSPERSWAEAGGIRLMKHRVLVEIGDRVANWPRSFLVGLL
jgi:hypothetical protein